MYILILREEAFVVIKCDLLRIGGGMSPGDSAVSMKSDAKLPVRPCNMSIHFLGMRSKWANI